MKRLAATLRIQGALLMILSLSMLPPFAISEWYHDGSALSFLSSFAITLLAGLILWLLFRKYKDDLKTRDGFLIVVMFWSVLSFFAALPFIFALAHVSWTDAMFESVSGLTATGTNVLHGLDHLPNAIRYYRQQLNFLGGLGVVVLAIAILPMLGVGGMQLYRAETAGPLKDTKLKPRIAETAKALWYIYVSLTALCAFSYWLAGMTPFDAISESFSTLATGGFAMHDASFAYYHSYTIDMIAVVFMVLGATNFGLHFQFLQNKNLSVYYKDSELRTFIIILFIGSAVTIGFLSLYHHGYLNEYKVIFNSIFTTVSLGTTTGLTTVNFNKWPTFLPFLMMFIALIGGCGGSTSGGVKVIRFMLVLKQIKMEIKRLVHPRGVWVTKLGDQLLPERVEQSVWGFVAAFIVIFAVLLLVLLGFGLDFRSAFGSLVACISNTGAAIGVGFKHFDFMRPEAKWTLIFSMLVGRLEIFGILVLLTPSYWAD